MSQFGSRYLWRFRARAGRRSPARTGRSQDIEADDIARPLPMAFSGAWRYRYGIGVCMYKQRPELFVVPDGRYVVTDWRLLIESLQVRYNTQATILGNIFASTCRKITQRTRTNDVIFCDETFRVGCNRLLRQLLKPTFPAIASTPAPNAINDDANSNTIHPPSQH